MDALDYEDYDRLDPPEDDPDSLCSMCGPPPCRHSREPLDQSTEHERDW
jgi:hypothetical protein